MDLTYLFVISYHQNRFLRKSFPYRNLLSILNSDKRFRRYYAHRKLCTIICSVWRSLFFYYIYMEKIKPVFFNMYFVTYCGFQKIFVKMAQKFFKITSILGRQISITLPKWPKNWKMWVSHVMKLSTNDRNFWKILWKVMLQFFRQRKSI